LIAQKVKNKIYCDGQEAGRMIEVVLAEASLRASPNERRIIK